MEEELRGVLDAQVTWAVMAERLGGRGIAECPDGFQEWTPE
jgi:hypothetical protein